MQPIRHSSQIPDYIINPLMEKNKTKLVQAKSKQSATIKAQIRKGCVLYEDAKRVMSFKDHGAGVVEAEDGSIWWVDGSNIYRRDEYQTIKSTMDKKAGYPIYILTAEGESEKVPLDTWVVQDFMDGARRLFERGASPHAFGSLLTSLVGSAVLDHEQQLPSGVVLNTDDRERLLTDVKEYIKRVDPAMYRNIEKIVTAQQTDDSWKEKCEVAKRSDTSPETLVELAEDLNYYVRECVARNSRTPSKVLDKLSTDKVITVRQYVASNPSTSVETLREMYSVEPKSMWKWIAKNPNCPPDLIQVGEEKFFDD